jgi:DNA-binding GntR family transcriptional regulator
MMQADNIVDIIGLDNRNSCHFYGRMLEIVDSLDDRNGHADTARTLAERLFRRLSNAIVSGDLAPGAKLSEPVLARQYGVSRGPLREALNRLQERHLVVRSPHVGARVAELSAQILEETFVVREALEGMAARQAAQNATEEDIAALRRAYGRHVTAAQEQGDGPVWRSADEDFHLVVTRASKNPVLIKLLCEDFYQLVRFYRTQLVHVRARGARTVAEHRRILEAIEDRDGELAELQMRRHITAAREQLGAALRQSGDRS